MQRLGRAQASTARHLDVQQRHIWPRLQSCRYYLIPLCDSSNHLDILFQAEQGGKRPTHHCLVFCQEHPDHNRTFLLLIVLLWAGSSTNSRKPSLPVDGVEPASSPVTWIGNASMCPPRAVTRSLRPERPLPARRHEVFCSCRASPSLITSARTVPFSRVSRMEQYRARLCRITLVTPSRTVQASTASVAGGSIPAVCSIMHSIPAAESICCAPSSSLSSVGCRYPATASRTSRRVWRAASSTSWISCTARVGSFSTRRPTSSLLSVINDRLCPSRSCRSRAIRSRSSTTARRASSSRAACSSRIALDRRATPVISRPSPRNSNTNGMSCSQSTRATLPLVPILITSETMGNRRDRSQKCWYSRQR